MGVLFQSHVSVYGHQRSNFSDKIFAFLLALAPILQHYNGIIGNAGITIMVIVLCYYVLIALINKLEIKVNSLKLVLPLMCFWVYRAFVHEISFSGIAHAIVMVMFLVAGVSGIAKISNVIKAASLIATVACVLVSLQNICYYLFGFHIQLVPTNALLPESSQWILGAETGLVGINGVETNLYRPSAFFLEPSHMFLYIFPLLYIVLLSPNMNRWRIRKAILFSAGIILTTSGMGICFTLLAWLLFLGLGDGKSNVLNIRNLFNRKKIIVVVCFLLAGILMVVLVPFLRQSVQRILAGDAISGRVSQANSLLLSLEKSQLLFGVTSSTDDIVFNLSGFAATFYKFGIIGIILSYSFYVRSTIGLKAPYNWIGFVILVVSFFSAHTHGTAYMLYYVLILLNGFRTGFTRKIRA